MGLKKSSAKLLPGGRTILFTSRAVIGDMAIMTTNGSTNQGFQSWVVNSKLANIYFLFSLGKEIKKQALRKASGSTFLEISNSEVKKLILSVPNLEEQTNIGKLLRLLDNLITLQQRKLGLLKLLKKAMLQQLLTSSKFPVLRFKGFKRDWEQRKLKDIAIISDGIHQTPNYVNKGIMFLSVENILDLKSQKYISNQDFQNNYKRKPLFHDIFMTRIGSVGVTNILETDESIAFYVSLALIHPQHVSAYYLNYLLKSPSSQKEIWKRTLHIAFPKKINKDEIGKINIKVSQNKQEQIEIGNLLKKTERLISLQQKRILRLQNFKQFLLQNMFI